MEELKKEQNEHYEKDILFSKAIKAGKRIYYIDVKKDRKDDLFISVTESKKINKGDDENPQFNFEKHKIFLYKEDFSKFRNGLDEALRFVEEQNKANSTETEATEQQTPEDFKFDIEF